MSTETSASTLGAEAVGDPFATEIIRNYFLSVVREMIGVTVRAAYSTSLSEGLDFTCGVFDARGRLFAQAGGNPIHIGALDEELQTMLADVGTIEPGDVLLHNDPFEGADHQSDVVVAVPMFHREELVGFSVNRGHWSDIGAMFAGGYGLARHVVQEGLIIPACKLYRRGELSEDIQQLILRNVRMPRQIWGDLQAQIASAQIAAQRMHELIERYGLDNVRQAIDHTLEYAHRRFRERMQKIPSGVYTAEDSLDDDGLGGGPFPIRVRIEKTDEKFIVDFTGTAPQAAGAANCTLAGTKAAVYTGLKGIVDPDIPYNSGILDLIEIHAPEGTVVNPRHPAPVCCAPADPANRICETVMRCWTDVVPDRAVAGSYSSGLNAPGWGTRPDGTEFMWYIFGPGGCGARRHSDGLTAQWHIMAMCNNESLEVWEARYPVRFQHRRLRTDSGGPGRMRGGLGDERAMDCLCETLVSGFVDRWASQPWAADGGHPGASNGFAVERDGIEMHFSELGQVSDGKFSNVVLCPGDRFIVRSGGGGGFGPPVERDPQAVAADVQAGYVSRSAAYETYRVALDDDGSVDVDATAVLRGSSDGGARVQEDVIGV